MSGFVYFMRPKGMLGPIKIGYSASPKTRLKDLAAWSPFPLEIAVTIEGEPDLERRLHGRFYASHSHLEWFHPTADIVKVVQSLEAGIPAKKVSGLGRRS
jgi:hypothetical protein